MSRIVVIGAGMGGLAAAARLATLGHDVTVCEQAPTVGGKLGLYERDGFRFDTGPSLLTLPAAFRDLFRKTGRPLEKVLDLVPVDPVARYRFADGTTLEMPNTSRPAIRAAMDGAFGSGAGGDWDRLLDRAEAIWQATRRPFLESPLNGAGDLARQAVKVGDLRTVAPWRTLRGLGRQYLRDPRQRMLLDRYATYTGSDPRRAPAALATVPYVEQTFGAWYIPGGLRRLADATAERAVRCGAAVRTGAAVRAVTLDSAGKVAGVLLADGEPLAAHVVVSDVDAATLYSELVNVPAPLARLRRATPSLSGFVVLLAVQGRTPGLAHHNVFFPAEYDAEFDDVFGPDPAPVRDPTIYLSRPDDPAVRPDGCEAWFLLVNAPRHGPVDWDVPGLADRYADAVLGLLAARGVDVRNRILFRTVRTPADLQRDTGSPGGAIYGTSSNGARAAFLRPANRSPVPGLFLVGGSAHPGGGLPLVTLSAAIVADLIGPA
ncbi:MAG: phytoene desaturase family protein [Actinomycetota bacterium]|nr:phytoene desaturase family protein [Actinomycetota bacterium]